MTDVSTTWAEVIFRVKWLWRWLWRWLPLRLSKRQSPTTVLFRTTLTQTITQYELCRKCVVRTCQYRVCSLVVKNAKKLFYLMFIKISSLYCGWRSSLHRGLVSDCLSVILRVNATLFLPLRTGKVKKGFILVSFESDWFSPRHQQDLSSRLSWTALRHVWLKCKQLDLADLTVFRTSSCTGA